MNSHFPFMFYPYQYPFVTNIVWLPQNSMPNPMYDQQNIFPQNNVIPNMIQTCNEKEKNNGNQKNEELIQFPQPYMDQEKIGIRTNINSSENIDCTELVQNIKKFLEIYIDYTGFTRISDLETELFKFSEKIVHFKELNTILFSKYILKSKTREEKTKFVIRNAFKFCKKKICEDNAHLNPKDIETLFFRKLKDHQENPLRFSTDKELKDFFLPFRRCSQIKTLNKEYMKELFTNTYFNKMFSEFLAIFDTFTEKENKKKITKSCKRIKELLKSKKISKVGRLKCLPWLKKWIEESKEIAKNFKSKYQFTTNSDNNDDSVEFISSKKRKLC